MVRDSDVAVKIRDVTPRDGLQAGEPVSVDGRVDLAIALAAAGLTDIEAASFVSAAAVPAMAGADEVFARLPRTTTTWWALVPNERGAIDALSAGARHITVTVSASAAYSAKNVRRTPEQAIAVLTDIAVFTRQQPTVLDAVVSCAFGSPFADVRNREPVISVIAGIVDALPEARITLADTTGTATPRRIDDVLSALPNSARVDLGLHLHDTRGTALANALWAIDHGIARFDTSTGGLGGSPFAPGAGGNLATEDLVLMLDDLGIATGVDLDAILCIAHSLEGLVGYPVPSRTSTAGALPVFERS